MNLTEYTLNTLIDMLNNMRSTVKVDGTFHGQMRQIKSLFANDKTALVSTILNFMIKTANVPIYFDAEQTGFQNLLNDWTKKVNQKVNIDIPSGLSWIGEQYYRERWKSSLIAVKIKWEKINGYVIPYRIWIMDGSSIHVKNNAGFLNTNEYYLGKPEKSKRLVDTETETIFIRKPYSQGYEQYPVPYLVQRGALEYAIQKSTIVDKQNEMLNSAFPYYLALKLGAFKNGQMPTPEELGEMVDDFKKKRNEYGSQKYAKGLIGGHPGDFTIDEFIPDFQKILEEKILKPVDKNLLYSLGLIELKGFSSTREEAILNPKVLVEEVESAVKDYAKLMEEIVELIKEKNSSKYKMNEKVAVQPGIIKAFLTDEMKTLIRSWYDRGLVGYSSALESTTPLKFETQIKERKREVRDKLITVCYPRLTQNQEPQGNPDTFPENDDVPDDKKKGTPESKNYKQASCWITCSKCKESFDYLEVKEAGMGYTICPYCNSKIDQEGKVYNSAEETECILEPMKTIRSIPNEIAKMLNDKQKQVFKNAFNEKFTQCTELEMDNKLREQTSLEYAFNRVKEYVEAPYTKKNYPPQLKNLPSGARNLWIRVFNRVFKDTGDEDQARQAAWHTVGLKYKKVGDKWVRKAKVQKAKNEESEEDKQLNELAKLQDIEIKEKKKKLLTKLLGEKENENL